MRILQYKVMTPKGYCTVNTLARAKEIESVYGGHHEMVLTPSETIVTAEQEIARKTRLAKIAEKFGIKY